MATDIRPFCPQTEDSFSSLNYHLKVDGKRSFQIVASSYAKAIFYLTAYLDRYNRTYETIELEKTEPWTPNYYGSKKLMTNPSKTQ